MIGYLPSLSLYGLLLNSSTIRNRFAVMLLLDKIKNLTVSNDEPTYASKFSLDETLK